MRSELVICDNCDKTVRQPMEEKIRRNWFHAGGYFSHGDFCSLACMVAYYTKMHEARIAEETQQKEEGN